MLNLDIPTLGECVAQWRHREGKLLSIPGTDPETGAQQTVQVPAWLFRGESTDYPDTYSSMHRFSLNLLSPGAREEILEVTEELEFALRGHGLTSMYSAALLQHYGLPTEVIDVTSSLDVAAAFAAHRNSGRGLLMAFPTAELFKHTVLIDLKGIHFARRPRHQAAFAIFHHTVPDLKNRELFSSLLAERVAFHGSARDLEQWEANYDLICGPPHTDATSGLLNKIVEDVVLPQLEQHKRFSLGSEARGWLDERIPWAPVPMRVVPGEVGVIEPAWDKF